MIYVVATTEVKPEHRDAYIKGARECIAETRKETGCIHYDLHASISNPNLLVFVEQWEDAEALVPHRGQEHMKTFGRVAVKCFTAPPKVEVITPEKVETR